MYNPQTSLLITNWLPAIKKLLQYILLYKGATLHIKFTLIFSIQLSILYFYNKESGEFKKIAIGIEDIYYNTDDPEEMIAKKGTNAEILDNEQTFLIYE